MTLLIDAPDVRAHDPPADRLRSSMAAMRLSFTWFGVRKTLNAQQKAEAAGTFGAEGDFLSAGKKLIDTRDQAFKAVTSVRGRASSFFRGISLPFPEPGIRLVRQDDLDGVNEQMGRFKEELDEAVVKLNDRFDNLKASARERLGRLFNPGDYPDSLIGLFEIAWDFPSVEAPSYLRQLNPELYHQECERVQSRFNEAVRLAEQAFFDELSKLVGHLTERLSGSEDGKPKVFRDSAIENLTEFFDRFRRINIGSHEQLDQLVDQAQQIVRGIEPQQLRDNNSLRQEVASQLAGVQSVLDGLLVDRPRRAVLRKSR